MPVTLQEIARLTGTSQATVSRALAGSKRISQATRDRILTVAERFNYRPNLVARSMVNKKTNLVGLIVPLTAEGPYARVVEGVEALARSRQYSVILCQTEYDPQVCAEHLRLVAGRCVDGVLMCPGISTDFTLDCLEHLGSVESRPPVVLLQEPFEQTDLTSVTVDNMNSSEALTKHLLGLGHRHIGFVRWGSNRVNDLRFAGFTRAMVKAGVSASSLVSAEARLIRTDETDDPAGVIDPGWLDDLLRQHRDWTALVVEHDMLAMRVIHALKRVGRRVPDDMAVVGFDDTRASPFIDPPLTTMRQPSLEVGRRACELLLDEIEGGLGERIQEILPCEMKVRRSCGASRPLKGTRS